MSKLSLWHLITLSSCSPQTGNHSHHATCPDYLEQKFFRPLPVKIPTTLAFDPKSPLKSFVTKDKINPSLAAYNIPVEYDFHAYPPADILAPLYKHELEAQKGPVQIILGRKRDPHLVDK